MNEGDQPQAASVSKIEQYLDPGSGIVPASTPRMLRGGFMPGAKVNLLIADDEPSILH